LAKIKKRWYQKAGTYRKVTQGLVFLAMTAVYLRHIVFLEGNVEEFCPFGGLETLFSYLTTGTYLKHINPLNLGLFVAIMGITLAFRGGFCGWICPIGTAQDLLRTAGKKIGGFSFLKGVNTRYKIWVKGNNSKLVKVDFWARKFKYLFLIIIIAATWIKADLVIRDFDLIVALMKILAFELSVGLIILVLIVILSFFMDRPFCKYFCVLGATINLVGKLSPLRVVRNDKSCINCNLCNKSCPMQLEIAKVPRVESIDCNHCFRCLDACPVADTLDLAYFPKGIYTSTKKPAAGKLEV